MIGDEFILEIDQTLDQLIKNAETISHIDLQDLSEAELEAFQKTQESLLHHFIRMDELAKTKQITHKGTAGDKIQHKLQEFQRLQSRYQTHIARRIGQKPIVCKRRAKRVLHRRLPYQYAASSRRARSI